MPLVNGKHFSYDKKGRAAAKKEAAKSDKPLIKGMPKTGKK